MGRKWVVRLIVAAVWAVGCFVAWGWVPYRELETHPPPVGMRIVGFTRDGNEVWVHAEPLPEGRHNPLGIVTNPSRGPIEIRDARTGEVRQTRLTSADEFEYVRLVGGTDDWLVGRQAVPGAADPDARRLRLVNLTTGTETTVGYTQFRHSAWWELAEDGSAVAVVSSAGAPRQVELFELPSARPLGTLVGCLEPFHFSAGGRRFYAQQEGGGSAVWEVPSLRPLATPGAGGEKRPTLTGSFSPDGELVFDHTGGAWDVTTGIRRYQLPAAVRWFTRDGRHVLVETRTGNDGMLQFFDWRTGVEDASRAVNVTDLPFGRGSSLSPDGRYWIPTGWKRYDPGYTLRQLARIPKFAHLGKQSITYHVAIVDLETGRVVADLGRGEGGAYPDGTIHVTDSRKRTRVFDLPPQRSWPWAAGLLGGWTVAVVGVVLWRRARRRTQETLDRLTDPVAV